MLDEVDIKRRTGEEAGGTKSDGFQKRENGGVRN
jgi:hypothetical protein